MSLPFSEYPGAWERHLKRKQDNPLFGSPQIDPRDIQAAQERDALELARFREQFHQLVEQAAGLDANAEADVVLKLKEQLDRAYEQCAGMAGDQSQTRDMLKRLLAVIMQAMWQGIGQDVQAHSKLQTETQAREAHFELLEFPLVADLLRPESPIDEDELVATLLSESATALGIAMQLFSPEQQMVLYENARQLVEAQQIEHAMVDNARQRLDDMRALLQTWNETPS